MIAGLPSPFEPFVRNLFARLAASGKAATALHHCPSCGFRQLVSPHRLVAEDNLRLPPPLAQSGAEAPARPRLVAIEPDVVMRPNRDHLIQIIPEPDCHYQPAAFPPAARRRGR